MQRSVQYPGLWFWDPSERLQVPQLDMQRDPLLLTLGG